MAGIVALLGVGLGIGCGEDTQPLVNPPPKADPDDLLGSWKATQPGGYTLRYVFRPDGTYRHVSLLRQKARKGRSSFEIIARGTVSVRGRTLVLRPRSGTKERHNDDDPAGDYKRPLERHRQTYEWSVTGSGKDARLVLSIGGALAVTYKRE
jgi:hypothetical protein